MFEAIGEQLQKRIFHSRNRKLKARLDLKDHLNTPLLMRIQDQRLVNKKLSQVRIVSRHSGIIEQTCDTNNIVLVAKRATRYNIETRYSPALQTNRVNKDEDRSDSNSHMIQINGLIVEPVRYRSLLSSRPAASKSRCQMRQDKTPSKINTFLINSCNNNEDLIRKILANRGWKQLKRGEGIPTMKWLAGDYGPSLFAKLSKARSKKILNQFEGHSQVTTKNGLIRNLQFYTQTKKIELFSITPITFLIDFQDQFCEPNLKQFLSFFMKNSPRLSQLSKQNSFNKMTQFVEKFGSYMSTRNSQLKKRVNQLSKPIMSSSYIQGDSYIWLLKPTGLNRGRGIQIFNTLQQLEKYLIGYLQIAGRKKMTESVLLHSSRTTKKSSSERTTDRMTDKDQILSDSDELKKSPAEDFTLRNCSFVIQKYIEKPLLIGARKFDIRVWVFLNHDMNVYFFKEGYLRMSSEKYSATDINNYFIHLTNNAVQKYSKEYGQFQSGNQISFASFRNILAEQGVPDKFPEIIQRIKQYSYVSLSSIRTKVNPHSHKYCFQIFGFDYILDETYKVWLIEVNNNPCIECSSPILGQYIPRMLDDAFNLAFESVLKTEDQERQEFPVDGYSNKVNMWEKLGKLAPNSSYKA